MTRRKGIWLAAFLLAGCAEEPLPEASPALATRVVTVTTHVTVTSKRPPAARLPPRKTQKPVWPAGAYPVSPADLNFGRQQVRALLRDRPAAAHWVQVGDPMFEWAARRFAGASCGSRIVWSPNHPADRWSSAWHIGPSEDQPGELWCERSPSGEHIWACVVFELFNITHTPNWNYLDDLIVKRSIDRSTYMDSCAYQEYLTTLTQHQFFQQSWRRYQEANGEKVNEWLWYPAWEWKEFKKEWYDGHYPESLFGEYFEVQRKLAAYKAELAAWNKAREAEEKSLEAEEKSQEIGEDEKESDDGVADYRDYFIGWKRRSRAARQNLPIDPVGNYPIRRNVHHTPPPPETATPQDDATPTAPDPTTSSESAPAQAAR